LFFNCEKLYSWSSNYAVKLMICTGLIGAASSCIGLSDSPAKSLELRPGPSATPSDTAAWRFTLLTQDPYVYQRIDNPAGASAPLFMTVLKDCSFGKGEAAPSAARSLLVGMKELRIQQHRTVAIKGIQAARQSASAKIEGRPVRLVTYTIKQEGCVSDYALWSDDTAGAPLAAENIDRELAGFEAYLANTLSAG
jgi:hypothetical protein